jgi:hypothetical protein
VKRILVVSPIAEREIEATARWYEAREPGLGEAFIVELLRRVYVRAVAHGRRRPGYWNK